MGSLSQYRRRRAVVHHPAVAVAPLAWRRARPGSRAHDALRLVEAVGTDFVQQVAEWSVLYAKEVSEPG